MKSNSLLVQYETCLSKKLDQVIKEYEKEKRWKTRKQAIAVGLQLAKKKCEHFFQNPHMFTTLSQCMKDDIQKKKYTMKRMREWMEYTSVHRERDSRWIEIGKLYWKNGKKEWKKRKTFYLLEEDFKILFDIIRTE